MSQLFFGLQCQRMAGGIRLIKSAMQFLKSPENITAVPRSFGRLFRKKPDGRPNFVVAAVTEPLVKPCCQLLECAALCGNQHASGEHHSTPKTKCCQKQNKQRSKESPQPADFK